MSESYTVGGNAFYSIHSPAMVGQTFSPLEAHKIDYIDVHAKAAGPGGRFWASLFDLDEDPDMKYTPLRVSKYTNWAKRNFWEVTPVRFTMRPVLLTVGKTYGFIIRSEPEPWWNKVALHYEKDTATYPRGQRFTKANINAAPEYFPNDDLMFVEFGEPPIPPPPPDPPIDNWTILDVQQIDTLTGLKFVVTTNVPVNLTMRWTYQEPWKHKVPVLLRGVWLRDDIYICWNVFHDNLQLEPGDTVYHTFIKEPWPVCETRWFSFIGTVAATTSKSSGPLFKKHRVAPLWPACSQDHGGNDLTGVALAQDWRIAQQFASLGDCKYNHLFIRIGPWQTIGPTADYIRLEVYQDDGDKPASTPLMTFDHPCDGFVDGFYYDLEAKFDDIHLERNQWAWVVIRFQPPVVGWNPRVNWRGDDTDAQAAGYALRAISYELDGTPIWEHIADFPPHCHHFLLDWQP